MECLPFLSNFTFQCCVHLAQDMTEAYFISDNALFSKLTGKYDGSHSYFSNCPSHILSAYSLKQHPALAPESVCLVGDMHIHAIKICMGLNVVVNGHCILRYTVDFQVTYYDNLGVNSFTLFKSLLVFDNRAPALSTTNDARRFLQLPMPNAVVKHSKRPEYNKNNSFFFFVEIAFVEIASWR